MKDDKLEKNHANSHGQKPEDDLLQIQGENIFNAYCPIHRDFISSRELWDHLKLVGIQDNDPRLKEVKDRMTKLPLISEANLRNHQINKDDFTQLIAQNSLLRKALLGNLVIPDFESFVQNINEIYDNTKKINAGKVADYIPQLARVNPDYFAVSICTIDGQRFSLGDHQVDFCLQSTCKPLLYAIAQEDIGAEKVHQHVGMEPSGLGFNDLSLDRKNLPHNPLINAGAIMCCSLFKRALNIADRFDYVMNVLQELAGGSKPHFNNAVYLSEKQTADRNFALAYFMRENNAFPPDTDILETLEFYFQCCSIETNAEAVAGIGATLANAGICPLTDKRILKKVTVQNCISLMLSCGMYDYSGEFAFKIGLPAKSGVSGALMVVIPDLMGICIYAPPLDKIGNSVKAVEFCRQLAEKYNVHKFDVLAGDTSKRNLKLKRAEAQIMDTIDLIYAASNGNLLEIQRLVANGVDLEQGDYDLRSALHLAASEGHLHVVKYLLEKGISPNPRDRWGRTPLEDARRSGHEKVVQYLTAQGADD